MTPKCCGEFQKFMRFTHRTPIRFNFPSSKLFTALTSKKSLNLYLPHSTFCNFSLSRVSTFPVLHPLRFVVLEC